MDDTSEMIFHPEADFASFTKTDIVITSLAVHKSPRHWTITVFNRGSYAGMLIVNATGLHPGGCQP